MQSHWVAFLFLAPGGLMLILHHWLGLSDALNVTTPPGELEAHLFNWIMAALFLLGVAAFSLHAFSLWSRGWRWVWAKLIFLGLYWSAILILARDSRPCSLVGDDLPIPSGESPDGTGRWPVLPIRWRGNVD